MKSLVIRATVTFPGGGTYYQENGWTKTDQEFDTHMNTVLTDAAHQAQALGGKGGPLAATLSANVDGVKQPDVHVTGVTEDGLLKFEKHAHAEQGKIIALGEHKAKTKTK